MTSPCSALGELIDRLQANGIEAEPLRVATAILAIARVNEWTERPEQAAEWIELLAMEVVSASPGHAAAASK